jgi:hypothetical protein
MWMNYGADGIVELQNPKEKNNSNTRAEDYKLL